MNDVGLIIRKAWKWAERIPGGKTLFSKMIGNLAPYSGTIRAFVVELQPGYSKFELRDQPRVRNHLKSVHAMALANLGEISSGVGLMYSLPDGMRAILIGFKIEYLKKARGKLTSTTQFSVPSQKSRQDLTIPFEIKNIENEVVSRGEAIWRLDEIK